MGSGYLRSGLVSVSAALVLGVLTLVYRIPELSRKLKEVNSGNSEAEYGVQLHHEFGKGKSKRRNTRSVSAVRGNRDSRSEMESGCTYVCGVSGVQDTRIRTEKGELLCM